MEYYEQALVIQKTLFGENHNDVATTLWNIGAAYGTLKDNNK